MTKSETGEKKKNQNQKIRAFSKPEKIVKHPVLDKHCKF